MEMAGIVCYTGANIITRAREIVEQIGYVFFVLLDHCFHLTLIDPFIIASKLIS